MELNNNLGDYNCNVIKDLSSIMFPVAVSWWSSLMAKKVQKKTLNISSPSNSFIWDQCFVIYAPCGSAV